MFPPLSVASFSVKGRNFLITGGTQGIGFATAKVLKENGATGLVLVSRNKEKGEEACKKLREDGNSENKCKCEFISADMNDAESASSIVSKAYELLNAPIHGVVNSASTTARNDFWEETAEGFDSHMAINVRAPFLIMKEAAKHMQEHDIAGSIVNISSVNAHGGSQKLMAYSASKAALDVLTRNAAHELAPKKIRINAVNVGKCLSDREDSIQSEKDPDWLEKADAEVPLGRILRSEDVAVTVAFLLSDAATMTTSNSFDLHPDFALGMKSNAPPEN